MTKEKIINGCEFQNGCIEYKDISYLKVMPICAIHELSIACHDKENKCKYYQIYKQIKHLKQENEKLKEAIEQIKKYVNNQVDDFGNDVYGITKEQIEYITSKINEVLI